MFGEKTLGNLNIKRDHKKVTLEISAHPQLATTKKVKNTISARARVTVNMLLNSTLLNIGNHNVNLTTDP